MLFRYFTIARSEFPCATTNTFFPDFIVGTIVSFQKGSTLSIVVFRLCVRGMGTYVRGSKEGSTSLYFLSNLG